MFRNFLNVKIKNNEMKKDFKKNMMIKKIFFSIIKL